jgi:hypothetical protein
VEKKTILTAVFVSMLLFSAVAGTQLVNLGSANPYIRDFEEEGEMPAPEGTEPLTILILSPENYTSYASNNISLIFNISMPESIDFFWSFQIFYNASWQPNKTYVDYGNSALSNTINLTDIPEGSHSIEVVAEAKYTGYTTRQEFKDVYYYAPNGDEYKSNVLVTYYVSYRLNGSSTVNFTIDLPPRISILSLENKIYNTSNVTLDFTVNEPISKVTYSLDGKENVSIAGNTTLTGLFNGDHNVTVYATDKAGNIGASETMYFTIEVPEPFSTTLVIASFAASVAVLGVGLIVYFKKRKH